MAAPETITRTYGKGSFLAFLSPLLSFFMARRGLNGWEGIAAQEMERDVLEMEHRGYRVVSADEFTLPALGVTWFRVTYGRPPGL